MFKSKFIRFLACSFFIVGSLCLFIKAADANPPQVTAMPEGSYQLARSTFLPEATDDVWLSRYGKIPNNYNQSPCKKMGYPLKNQCPDHGNCSKCPSDSNYLRLDSCNNDGSQRYQVSSDRTSCKKVCNVQTCNTSTYFMSTCPDGMDCDKCTEVKSDCTTIVHLKPTTRCISGFHYEGGRCVKDCAEVKCGPGYGIYKEWKDQCAKGYLCTKRSTDYQTTDCKTGSCYQYKGCDEANGYFKPSWSSGGECEYMACYQTATNCAGYSFTSCPANGVCDDSCTVKNKDCSTKETKYNLTGCASGYHFNSTKTACDKDCLKDSVGTYPNTVYYAPIYKTEIECENAEGVSQCMSRYVNTDTLCNLSIYYIPARCETGYKMVQTKTTENGYPKTTFKCEKENMCPIEEYPITDKDYCEDMDGICTGCKCNECTETDGSKHYGCTEYSNCPSDMSGYITEEEFNKLREKNLRLKYVWCWSLNKNCDVPSMFKITGECAVGEIADGEKCNKDNTGGSSETPEEKSPLELVFAVGSSWSYNDAYDENKPVISIRLRGNNRSIDIPVDQKTLYMARSDWTDSRYKTFCKYLQPLTKEDMEIFMANHAALVEVLEKIKYAPNVNPDLSSSLKLFDCYITSTQPYYGNVKDKTIYTTGSCQLLRICKR